MVQFKLGLADLIIQVSALYESTADFCRNYRTDKTADFAVGTSYEDIVLERERAEKEDRALGIPIRPLSDEYLETLAVYRRIAEHLPTYGVLLFHGSAVAMDGRCYLFTAKSGTGKSTHTRLWRERFGSRAVMVNDDKPLLRVSEEGATVYGTPWDGKHHLSANIGVRLSGLCLLNRSRVNHMERVTAREAWPMLMQQTYRPVSPDMLAKTLILVDRLSQSVPLWRLGCNMEPEAARVAYDAMRERYDGE